MNLVQMFPQFLESQLDVFFHRSHGDAQLGGDLFVGTLLIPAHLEDKAALGRHFINDVVDTGMGLVEFGPEFCTVRGGSPGRGVRVGRPHQVPLGFEDIQGGVPGQHDEIVLQRQGRIQAFPVQPYFHEDALGQVLGQGSVLYQGEQEPFHLGIPTQEKRIESAVVPIPYGGDEVVVRHFPVFVHVVKHGTKVWIPGEKTKRAECEVRTRDLRLGKPPLYQLS